MKSGERRLFIQCVHLGKKANKGEHYPPTPPLPIPTHIDQALSLAPVYGLTHSSSGWDQASASPLPQSLHSFVLVVQQPRGHKCLSLECVFPPAPRHPQDLCCLGLGGRWRHTGFFPKQGKWTDPLFAPPFLFPRDFLPDDVVRSTGNLGRSETSLGTGPLALESCGRERHPI